MHPYCVRQPTLYQHVSQVEILGEVFAVMYQPLKCRCFTIRSLT